jgi:hypothetical protein
MNNNNQYYVITKAQLDLCSHEDVVGDRNKLEPLSDGNYIIKTKVGVVNCEHMAGNTPLTQKEAQAYLASITPETE